MNYLAHLYLSGCTPEAVLGALLGDFVKGSLGTAYNQRIRQGILLHRRIDRFTDDHEVVREGRRIISIERRRFAGIMIDVFFDHFLARHWSHYADIVLEEFARDVYVILMRHHNSFPQRLQYMVPRMVRDDWLVTYRELWRIDLALNGISRRLRRVNALTGGARELEANYVRFEECFLAFFPELMRFVDQDKTSKGIIEDNVWKRETENTDGGVD
ncbi:MAG: ACP phosphodiesterase [Acidiferrobacterales bacterium]